MRGQIAALRGSFEYAYARLNDERVNDDGGDARARVCRPANSRKLPSSCIVLCTMLRCVSGNMYQYLARIKIFSLNHTYLRHSRGSFSHDTDVVSRVLVISAVDSTILLRFREAEENRKLVLNLCENPRN